MEACCAQMKFTQTEDGFRIDFTGKEARGMMDKCKEMMAKCCEEGKSECCEPGEEKK